MTATAVGRGVNYIQPFGRGTAFGDQIQWSRYLPHYDAPGAKMVVNNELFRLFHRLWPKVEAFEDTGLTGVSVPPLYGLQPARLEWERTHSPADLPPLPALWADDELQLPPRSAKLRAGVCWRGSAADERSVPPDVMRPLLALEGVEWVALQLADHASELSGLLSLADLGVRDFADTAGVVKQLDLIITVDTSVAHLAASLRAPTWVLEHSGAIQWEPRLMTRKWYPTARVFKQPIQGGWPAVIEAVRAEIEALTN